MVWAEVILFEKMLLVFHCFTNKMVLFGFAKSKAINFSFKDYFDRSICNFQRLAWQKTIQIRCSRKFKSFSMRAHGSTQRNRFTRTSLSRVCSMYHKLLAYTEINFQKNMWFSSCLLTVLGVQGLVGKCSCHLLWFQ